jgi:glutaredoxin-like protein NrdH
MSVKEHIKHVDGTKKGDIMLYALSTCGWCQKTKGLLNDLKVDYSYVDTDLLEGADREEALGEIRKWNPACSFPTIVINNNKCIVGFKEDQIRETLGHDGK